MCEYRKVYYVFVLCVLYTYRVGQKEVDSGQYAKHSLFLVLLFVNCIIFHTNCKPTFAPPYVHAQHVGMYVHPYVHAHVYL